jgi:tRNA-2-methylthio-N6-dimethylallyladenosine synthase
MFSPVVFAYSLYAFPNRSQALFRNFFILEFFWGVGYYYKKDGRLADGQAGDNFSEAAGSSPIMKQVHITTFGCQMNENDSLTMLRLLAACDYEKTEWIDQADLILLNTCSIRQKAEEKTYSFLGRLKPLKEKNTGLIIGVGGCVAQQEGERLLERVPFLDLVFGTRWIFDLPNLIDQVGPGKGRLARVEMVEGGLSNRLLPVLSPNLREPKASVTIMQGCNNFCAYCVVPFVRGREESRPSRDIWAEVEALVAGGVKEILLLGQNVNSYGQNQKEEWTFARLLQSLEKVSGLERIRFTTSHPKDLSGELIDCFGQVTNLCPHIHLPVQAGSNRILERMGRGYTREAYLEKIDRIRDRCPEMAITSDIIVGFPGEAEADFDQTMALVEQVRYDDLFSFKYSDRPQARSRHFSEKVDEEEKGRRLKVLQDYQKKVTLEKNQTLEGSVQKVLVEGRSKKNYEEWMGRTGSNKIVNFPGPVGLLGKTVAVRVEKAYINSLKGQLIA